MRKGSKNPFFGKKHRPEVVERIRQSCRRNCKGHIDLAEVSIKIPESELEKGYIAGLVDGEGSIGIRKATTSYIAVYNNNKEVISWLLKKLGGNVKWDADKRGRENNHQWQISAAKDVYHFCKNILPYLIIKRKNAEETMQFLENRYGDKLNGR